MNYMQIQQVPYSIVQEKTLFVGVRAKILLFGGVVQKYYCPEILSLRSLVQGPFQRLCRNISFEEKYSPLSQSQILLVQTNLPYLDEECGKFSNANSIQETDIYFTTLLPLIFSFLHWSGDYVFALTVYSLSLSQIVRKNHFKSKERGPFLVCIHNFNYLL